MHQFTLQAPDINRHPCNSSPNRSPSAKSLGFRQAIPRLKPHRHLPLVLEWEPATPRPNTGISSLPGCLILPHDGLHAICAFFAPCGRQATSKPLFHVPPNVLFTQAVRIPQPFSTLLWETWETWPSLPPFKPTFPKLQISTVADLENSAPSQTPLKQSLRQLSHFSSSNYGYYCLFLLILYPFSLPVLPAIHKRKSHPSGLPFLKQTEAESPWNQANRVIQRTVPVFHAHLIAR